MRHLFGAFAFPWCNHRIQERKKHTEMSVPWRQSFDAGKPPGDVLCCISIGAVTVGFGKEEKAKTPLIFPFLKPPLFGRSSQYVGRPLGHFSLLLPGSCFHCAWRCLPVHLPSYRRRNWHYMQKWQRWGVRSRCFNNWAHSAKSLWGKIKPIKILRRELMLSLKDIHKGSLKTIPQ